MMPATGAVSSDAVNSQRATSRGLTGIAHKDPQKDRKKSPFKSNALGHPKGRF